MSRMIDRMLRKPCAPPPQGGKPFQFSYQRGTSIPIISADNVSTYYWEQSSQEYWDFGVDFPNLAPPFSEFFIEMAAPRQINSSESGISPWATDAPIHWGMYFQCVDLQQFDMREHFQTLRDNILKDREHFLAQRATTLRQWEQKIAPLLEQHGSPEAMLESLPKNEKKNLLHFLALDRMFSEILNKNNPDVLNPLYALPESPRWTMAGSLFLEYPHGIMGPVGTWHFPVKADGSLLTDASGEVSFLAQACGETDMERNQKLTRAFQSFVYPTVLTICFMHCKNVVQQRHSPNKKLSAEHRRQTGHPLIKYYTLEIDPMKKILREEGQSETLGLKKSLHICRGHFANYTEGKGLFGKYHGQYWIPQHVRGSAEQGIVEKDYAVKAPYESEKN